MREEKAGSLDQTITSLIEKASRVPKSMFGVDMERKIALTRKEHEEFQEAHSL
jgi:hypothetical protein